MLFLPGKVASEFVDDLTEPPLQAAERAEIDVFLATNYIVGDGMAYGIDHVGIAAVVMNVAESLQDMLAQFTSPEEF